MRLEEEEARRMGVASAPPPERDEGDDDYDDELECGICCLPYDRCGRAPRRLGGARGSWKPSRCRHVICSACVCQLAREGWWEEVTCPYCRAVTSLRERANPFVAGVRRGSGAARRRLVLPPIDAELWHRVVRLEEEQQQQQEEGRRKGRDPPGEATELPPPSLPPEEEEGGGDDDDEAGPRRLWRALKRLLKGGGGGGGGSAHARRGRSRSLPPRRRRRPPVINPYGSEMKDLALMTCYII